MQGIALHFVAFFFSKSNKTIVIDEFHRLEDDFLDFLHSIGKGGKFILISSTLYLSKKILTEKSPLLGLVAEMPLPSFAENQ